MVFRTLYILVIMLKREDSFIRLILNYRLQQPYQLYLKHTVRGYKEVYFSRVEIEPIISFNDAISNYASAVEIEPIISFKDYDEEELIMAYYRNLAFRHKIMMKN
ncbi:hypothetical protein RCL_jg20051.t1 [Rhizophagus clarus]|uniref:Uncharacterized protein n=1 Tax=Rhizophagus clarus TaxID=94130 RepID=A0A8H3LCD5_9GLOM|nr:hypothetical protein RCL_jg20051.t1 [Rhizophagus clarus]